YNATTSSAKTVAEVAQEVIAGKWGNGDVRRAAIEKAGYSFAEVQNAVNAILTGKKKSLETIAREVIAGKWGNGTVRKNALEKAGYDYLAVQNAVNKLLT
ncbi:MAG: lysozyme, partial [Agathobaculum sp.]